MSSEERKKYRLKSLKSTNSETNLCPICRDVITNLAMTDTCFHEFCSHCLKQWRDVPNNTCPLCRKVYHNIVDNIFDLLPLLPSNLAFVEAVGEQLLKELYETVVFRDNKAIYSDQRILFKIEKIMENNKAFINDKERHLKHCNRCYSYTRDKSLGFQLTFSRITENIVRQMTDSEHINRSIIEEILLAILRMKSEKIDQFFTYVFTDIISY